MENLSFWEKVKSIFKEPIQPNFYYENAAKYKLHVIDKFHVKTKYKVSNIDLINLTCGCPVSDFTICYFQAYSIQDDIFKTECQFKKKGKTIASFERTIDFKNKEIINDKMIIKREGKGLCTNAFINQIITGSLMNFRLITLQAAGGINYSDNNSEFWKGYHHWGRYGFIMDEDYHEKFIKWCVQNERLENSLWDLCMTKDGYELWKEKGFSWYGYFYITKNSLSIKRLKRFLRSKNISIKLA